MGMDSQIIISRLRIPVFIGVPDEERAEQQEIEISVELTPITSLWGTNDEIGKTVDYFAVSQRLTQEAQARPRKLIEQLNEDLLKMVLKEFPIQEAKIKTYKFIIKNTEHVAISMRLTKQGSH